MGQFPFGRVVPAGCALGRVVDIVGHGVSDRVRMVFGASAISTTEADCIEAVRAIRQGCLAYSAAGGNLECVMTGIARTIWAIAEYDPDEGLTVRGDSGFDVYRSFYRLKQTRKYDCDCATVSSCAILSMLGYSCGARVIEQKDKTSGEWGWSHIYPFGIDRSTHRLVPLELTPVPPDGHKAPVGWQTPSTTYRRHLDFLYEPGTWSEWVKKCDLGAGLLAPLPRLSPARIAACDNCGLCNATP